MNQKGAALIYAMLAVAMGASIVAYVNRSLINQQVATHLFDRQMARNAIGRNIGESLANPLVILSSVDTGINLPGNNMLRTCLGIPGGAATAASVNAIRNGTENTAGNLATASQSGSGSSTTISGNACSMTIAGVPVNPSVGIEFLLVPEPTYVFGTSAANTNCPPPGQAPTVDLRSMSCFLAGNMNGQYPAYDLNGNTYASASTTAPFIAKAFFTPICSIANPSQTSCQFAEAISFRYELTEQAAFAKPGEFVLGTYPAEKTWVQLNSLNIVGMQCNTGAVATANEVSGQLQCTCYRPFSPLLDASGNPTVNAQGPICQNINECPPQGGNYFVLAGHDANSNPICQLITNSATPGGTVSFNTANTPSLNTCNVGGNGGWVSNITRTCKGTYNLSYQACPEGCSVNVVPIIIGLVIGLIVAIIALNIAINIMLASVILAPAAALLEETGMIPLIITLAIIVGMGTGAVTGYFMGQTSDWIYLDTTYGQTPYVSCDVALECSQIQ